MAPSPLPYVDAATVRGTLPWELAVDALEQSLLEGLDPATAGRRTVADVEHGQLLLMPAESASAVGFKLATVAPGNPANGLPRIQAVYVVLDRETLTPRALVEGTALTSLRTPATSALAVRHLAPADAHRLVVLGSGPQAWGHVQAICAVRPVDEVVVVGRDPQRAEALAARTRGPGLRAGTGTPDQVADADLVVCATTAATPLFDGGLVGDHACVVAVGSHEPDRRELDAALLARAVVGAGLVVESRDTALREAGDVVMAIDEGAVHVGQLSDLADVVRRAPPAPGLSVFKSVGMGWEDLVVAEAVLARLPEVTGTH